MKKWLAWIIVVVLLMPICANQHAHASEERMISSKMITQLEWLPNPEPGYDHTLGRSSEYSVIPFYNSDNTTDILLNPNSGGNLTLLRIDGEGTVIFSKEIVRELPLVGAYARDEKGNCYILFGQNTSKADEESIRLVQYDGEGNRKTKSLSLTQAAIDTVVPFESDTCSMTIHNGSAAICFGRLIDSAHLENPVYGIVSSLRHQGSCIVLANVETMEPLEIDLLSASHSFEQEICYNNGIFYIAERGDGNPRAFRVTSYQETGDKNFLWDSFSFKGTVKSDIDLTETETVGDNIYYHLDAGTNNETHSMLASILCAGGKTWLVGTYENTTEDQDLSPRNLFIQEVGSTSQPIYLTNYTDATVAEVGSAKAIATQDGQIAILYEENEYKVDNRQTNSISNGGFTTYFERSKMHFLVVSTDGRIQSDISVPVSKATYLPTWGTMGYSATDGSFRWVTYSQRQLLLNKFDPNSRKEIVPSLTLADFSDVQELYDWEKEALDWALEKGIITGFSDGTIRPYAQLSRAEFVTVIARTYGLKPSAKNGIEFVDVPSSHWAHSHIVAAADSGWVNGVGSGYFAPEALATPIQAAKVITEASMLTENIDIERSGGYPYAYDALAEFCNIYPRFFSAQSDKLTRIEMVQMLYNASNAMEFFFSEDPHLEEGLKDRMRINVRYLDGTWKTERAESWRYGPNKEFKFVPKA